MLLRTGICHRGSNYSQTLYLPSWYIFICVWIHSILWNNRKWIISEVLHSIWKKNNLEIRVQAKCRKSTVGTKTVRKTEWCHCFRWRHSVSVSLLNKKTSFERTMADLCLRYWMSWVSGAIKRSIEIKVCAQKCPCMKLNIKFEWWPLIVHNWTNNTHNIINSSNANRFQGILLKLLNYRMVGQWPIFLFE